MADSQPLRYFNFKPLSSADLSDTWQGVLKREISLCHDKAYRQHLTEALGEHFNRTIARVGERPTATEVEVALRLGCRTDSTVKNMWQPWLQRLYRAKHKRIAPEEWVKKLQHTHWLQRFVARHVLVYRAGVSVEALHQVVKNSSGATEETALWLLQSIGTETTLRLAPEKEKLMCPRCLTRCDQNWIDLAWRRDISFYGCRSCYQSRKFIYSPAEVVVVLDDTLRMAHWQQGQSTYINWAGHPMPFDFDRVEIISASDEEIERFAVRIGNDLDEFRRPRYSQMACTVSATCRLSTNSSGVLNTIFGQVRQETQ